MDKLLLAATGRTASAGPKKQLRQGEILASAVTTGRELGREDVAGFIAGPDAASEGLAYLGARGVGVGIELAWITATWTAFSISHGKPSFLL